MTLKFQESVCEIGLQCNLAETGGDVNCLDILIELWYDRS